MSLTGEFRYNNDLLEGTQRDLTEIIPIIDRFKKIITGVEKVDQDGFKRSLSDICIVNDDLIHIVRFYSANEIERVLGDACTRIFKKPWIAYYDHILWQCLLEYQQGRKQQALPDEIFHYLKKLNEDSGGWIYNQNQEDDPDGKPVLRWISQANWIERHKIYGRRTRRIASLKNNERIAISNNED